MQPLKVPVTQVGLEQSIQQAMKGAGRNAVINLGTNSRQINALAQPLGRITGQADEFTKSMEAANARVFAFGASVGIINGVTKAFAALVQNTIAAEKALVGINVNLQQSSGELDKFGNKLFDLAKSTGQSFSTVAEGALELSRQGLGATETVKRLNDALILSRLSGLDAKQAVEGLTAAFNSYKDTGITTTQIVDKLVTVSQKYAVSERDLIEGLKRSASTADLAGVSFNELVAVITATQEITARGGAVLGNAYKTIFSKIQDKAVLKDIEELGIKTTDASNEILPATKIIEKLAAEFQSLDKLQQFDLAKKIAGGYQLSNLLALFKDLTSSSKKYSDVLSEIDKSVGNSAKKNAILNETLDSIINRVSLSAEQLGVTLGKLGVTDNLKNLLNFFDEILTGIQNILGEESALGGLVRGLAKGIGNVLTGPGLALFGGIILKLSKDLVQFGFASLKTFFGIGKAAQEIASVEKSINNILATNVGLQQQLFQLEGNRAGQLKVITDALVQQEAVIRRSASISKDLGTIGYQVGLRATSGGLRINPKNNAAEGYMPAVAKESSDIAKGVGGARSGDKPVVIPNFNFGGGKKGSIVAHTGEYAIPNFAGSGGTAIFNRDMVRKMGLPAGAKKITASGGLIPNFAVADNKQYGVSFKQNGEIQFEGPRGFVGGTAYKVASSIITFHKDKSLLKGISVSKSDYEQAVEYQKNHLTAQEKIAQDKINKENSLPPLDIINAGGEQFGMIVNEPYNGGIKQAYITRNSKNEISGTETRTPNSIAKVDVPIYGVNKDRVKSKTNQGLIKNITDYLVKETLSLTSELGNNVIPNPIRKGKIAATFNKGSAASAAGSVFESAIGALLSDDDFKDFQGRAAGSLMDFKADSVKSLKLAPNVFNIPANQSKVGLEAKGSIGLYTGAAEKIYKIIALNKEAFTPTEEYKKQLELNAAKIKRASTGYIPNFAYKPFLTTDSPSEKFSAFNLTGEKQEQFNKNQKYYNSIVSRDFNNQQRENRKNFKATPDFKGLYKPRPGDLFYHGSTTDFDGKLKSNGLGGLSYVTRDIQHSLKYAQSTMGKRGKQGYVYAYTVNPNSLIFDATKSENFSLLGYDYADYWDMGQKTPRLQKFENDFGNTVQIQQRHTIGSLMKNKFHGILQKQGENAGKGEFIPKFPGTDPLQFGFKGTQVLGILPSKLKNVWKKKSEEILGQGLPEFYKNKYRAADGYIPNFANYVYDSDQLTPEQRKNFMMQIMKSPAKKNALLAPAGAGKTTIASKIGPFIKSAADIAKATEFTILSAAARTKDGGLSKPFQEIVSSVAKSGGKMSYLYVPSLEIKNRRSARTLGQGDLRSQDQLKGTKRAPFNQYDFLAKIKKELGSNFEIINGSKGYIPNFVSKSREMGRGVQGAFYRLGEKDGTQVGVKKFFKDGPSKAVEFEWLVSEFISKYANIPSVFGPKNLSTFEDSKRKQSIRKEIVSDPLAKTALGPDVARAFGRSVLFNALAARGLSIGDLHGSNYTVNKNAENQIDELRNYPQDTIGAFATLKKMASAGARIGILDPGAARVSGVARDAIGKILAKQFQQKNAAKGYIPNFASKYTKKIGEGWESDVYLEDKGKSILKVFKDRPERDESTEEAITNEWKIGKYINEKLRIKGITGPKILSDLYSSITGQSIKKQFISDPTADKALGDKNANTLGLTYLRKMIRDKSGLDLPDLKGANYTINQAAKNNFINLKGKALKSINDIALNGGKINIIDAGFAQILDDPASAQIDLILEMGEEKLAQQIRKKSEAEAKRKESQKSLKQKQNLTQNLGGIFEVEDPYGGRIFKSQTGGRLYTKTYRDEIIIQDLYSESLKDKGDLIKHVIEKAKAENAKVKIESWLDKEDKDIFKSIIKSGINKASTSKAKLAAGGYIPNFVDLSYPEGYQEAKRKRSSKNRVFRTANKWIDALLKTLPKAYVTDKVLGDEGNGLETDGILQGIGTVTKVGAMAFDGLTGLDITKFINEAEKRGFKVSQGLKKKLASLTTKAVGKVKGFSSGYMPNFADPLKEAVGREMAAGVPASQIYIDKNPSLKSAANPMGLMVANRRDEPAGGFQGINRAIKEGRNPKTYGAARGFVPNYAPQIGKFSPLNLPQNLQTEVVKFNKELQDIALEIRKNKISLVEANKRIVDFSTTLSLNPVQLKTLQAKGVKLIDAYSNEISQRNKQAEKLKSQRRDAQGQPDAPKSSKDMLGTIFAVQGALSFLSGATENAASQMAKYTNIISDGASTFTTAAFAIQGLGTMGGKTGAVLSKLGPYGMAAAGLFAAFKIGTGIYNELSGANKLATDSATKLAEASSKAAMRLDEVSPTTQKTFERYTKDLIYNLQSGKITQEGEYSAKSLPTSALQISVTEEMQKSLDEAISTAARSGINFNEIGKVVQYQAEEKAFTGTIPTQSGGYQTVTSISRLLTNEGASKAIEQLIALSNNPKLKELKSLFELLNNKSPEDQSTILQNTAIPGLNQDLFLKFQKNPREFIGENDQPTELGKQLIGNIQSVSGGSSRLTTTDFLKTRATEIAERNKTVNRDLGAERSLSFAGAIKGLYAEKILRDQLAENKAASFAAEIKNAKEIQRINSENLLDEKKRNTLLKEQENSYSKIVSELKAKSDIDEKLLSLTEGVGARSANQQQSEDQISYARKFLREFNNQEVINGLQGDYEQRQAAAQRLATIFKAQSSNNFKDNQQYIQLVVESALKFLPLQKQINDELSQESKYRQELFEISQKDLDIQKTKENLMSRSSASLQAFGNQYSRNATNIGYKTQILEAQKEFDIAKLRADRPTTDPIVQQKLEQNIIDQYFQKQVQYEQEQAIASAKADYIRNIKIEENIKALDNNSQEIESLIAIFKASPFLNKGFENSTATSIPDKILQSNPDTNLKSKIEEVLEIIYQNTGISPTALSKVISVESGWDKNNSTGQYYGLAQMGPKSFGKNSMIKSMSFEEYKAGDEVTQLQAWLEYLKNSKNLQKFNKNALSELPVEMQAAIVQANQFAPNGRLGDRNWADAAKNNDFSVASAGNTQQAKALGNTSIEEMSRYFSDSAVKLSKNLGQQEMSFAESDLMKLDDQEAMFAIALDYVTKIRKENGLNADNASEVAQNMVNYANALKDASDAAGIKQSINDINKATQDLAIAPKTFSQGMKDGFTNMKTSLNNFKYELGLDIPQMFSTGLSNAIMAAIDGTSSLKDALKNSAYEFVKTINQRNIQNLADQFTYSFRGPSANGESGAGYSAISNIIGSIANSFASGGPIVGGSGNKDDVPAMLMGGEFVINKKAAQKYGMDFLTALNNGSISGYAKGGKVQSGGQGNYFTPGQYNLGGISGAKNLLDFASQAYTGGSRDQMVNKGSYAAIALEAESARLTNFGRRTGPAAEALRSAKGEALGLYLQDYRAKEELRKQQKAQDKAFRNQLIVMAASMAGSAVAGSGAAGFKNAYAASTKAGNIGATRLWDATKGIWSGGDIGNGIMGGGLNNLFSGVGSFATGNFQKGANQMRLSQIGSLEELNKAITGYDNRKFAEFLNFAPRPSIVSGSSWNNRATGGSIPSASGIDTIPTMLSGGEFIMNRAAAQNIGSGNLQALNSGARSLPTEEKSEELNDRLIAKLDELIEASGSGSNITINVESSGKETQNAEGNPAEAKQQLARQIRDAVLKVIQEEKRLGGQLRR